MRNEFLGVTLMVVVGCSDLPPSPATRAEPAPVRFSDWSAPISLGSMVNSAFDDQGPAESSDGLNLFFASNRPGGAGGLDLYLSQRATRESPWTTPRNLGNLVNGTGNEDNPSPTFQGTSPGRMYWDLYFDSDRPGGCGAEDLWRTAGWLENEPSAGTWSEPRNLNLWLTFGDFDKCKLINTPDRESGPVFASFFERRDLYVSIPLYFVRTPTAGLATGRMYTAQYYDEWGFDRELIEELGSEFGIAHPTIRGDGLELFFALTRSAGTVEIWTSTRSSTSGSPNWSAPAEMGAVINTPSAGSPWISADGTALYFSSPRPGGEGGQDLYVATRRRIS